MLREPENPSWGPSEEGLAQSLGLLSGKDRPGLTPTPPLHKAGQGEPQQDQVWDSGVMTFIASTGDPDRNGNVLDLDGWELENYRANPVVLFNHNWDLPPVGRTHRLYTEGGQLLAQVEFAPTPLGQELALLNADGYLRAISVGAQPLEWEIRRDPKHGFPMGIHSHRHELLELSIVPIPANPATLRASLSTGEMIEPPADAILSYLKDSPRRVGQHSLSSPDLSERLRAIANLKAINTRLRLNRK